MGFSVHWDNAEKTAIRYTFIKQWSWKGIFAALDSARSMADNGGYAIDIILDIGYGDPLPSDTLPGLNAMSHARNLALRAALSPGIIVIVGANPLIRAVYDTYYGIYGDRHGNIQFVNDIDEAREALYAERIYG
jgi:hypothetical protein